jgi:hypothetical protein
MKRSPIKRKTPLKRSGRKLRPVSKKRARENRAYTRLREWYLEQNPACEICGKKATQIHHKRGRFGARLNEKEYFMAICMACHDWIHKNPMEAYAKGYMLLR